MTYAWISTLEVTDTTRTDEMRERLHGEIIPNLKSTPGFQKGYWFQDTENSNGGAVVLLFESEDSASALEPPDFPVKVHSRGLYRLVTEAFLGPPREIGRERRGGAHDEVERRKLCRGQD